MSHLDSHKGTCQSNLRSCCRTQWIPQYQDQIFHWRNGCKIRQKSFTKWGSEHRHWNARKNEANDRKTMAQDRSHQTCHSRLSWWNDQWISRSNEGHLCLASSWYSSLSYFSHHAKRSALNYRKFHERPHQNSTGEEGSTSERNQAVLHCYERRQSEIWNIDSALQKFGNWSMHYVCQHKRQSNLAFDRAQEAKVPNYRAYRRYAWLGTKISDETISRGRGKSVGINWLDWSRNWCSAGEFGD